MIKQTVTVTIADAGQRDLIVTHFIELVAPILARQFRQQQQRQKVVKFPIPQEIKRAA